MSGTWPQSVFRIEAGRKLELICSRGTVYQTLPNLSVRIRSSLSCQHVKHFYKTAASVRECCVTVGKWLEIWVERSQNPATPLFTQVVILITQHLSHSICLTLDRHYRGRRTHSLVAPMRKCKLDSSAAEFFLFSRTRTPNVNQGPFPSSPFAALLVCQADDDFFC